MNDDTIEPGQTWASKNTSGFNIKIIAVHGDHAWAADEDDRYATYALHRIQTNYTLVPPFFTVGKTYRRSGPTSLDDTAWYITSVTDIAGNLWAVAIVSKYGKPIRLTVLNEFNFESMEESTTE